MKLNFDKLKKLQPRLIGSVGVDAGLVWIGDPCYIMHKETPPIAIGENWNEFVDTLVNADGSFLNAKSYTFDMGHEGLGVCTSTYHGDGVYPVVGFYESEEDTRPKAVIIDFYGMFN